MNSDGIKLETGLFTVSVDGKDMKEILPYGSSVSHFGWRNDEDNFNEEKSKRPLKKRTSFGTQCQE